MSPSVWSTYTNYLLLDLLQDIGTPHEIVQNATTRARGYYKREGDQHVTLLARAESYGEHDARSGAGHQANAFTSSTPCVVLCT